MTDSVNYDAEALGEKGVASWYSIVVNMISKGQLMARSHITDQMKKNDHPLRSWAISSSDGARVTVMLFKVM